MLGAVEQSSASSRAVFFLIEEISKWKEVAHSFNFLSRLRKFFAYEIHIRAEWFDGAKKVVVDVFRDPEGEVLDISKNLFNSNSSLPQFDTFNVFSWNHSLFPEDKSCTRMCFLDWKEIIQKWLWNLKTGGRSTLEDGMPLESST